MSKLTTCQANGINQSQADAHIAAAARAFTVTGRGTLMIVFTGPEKRDDAYYQRTAERRLSALAKAFGDSVDASEQLRGTVKLGERTYAVTLMHPEAPLAENRAETPRLVIAA